MMLLNDTSTDALDFAMRDASGVVWKSLSLTHVVYPQGDFYGKTLGLASLLPHALIVAFFTLTLFVRDIHVISFFAGQIGNELVNLVLKRIFKEGRPEQFVGRPNVNDSYGWPSNHCQFQAFFFTYSTLCILFRLLRGASDIWKILFYSFLLTSNTVALWLVVHSRTYLRYHFAHQCYDGALIGSVLAILWYITVTTLVEPYILVPLMKSKYNVFLNLQSIYLPISNSKVLGSAKQTKKTK